MKYEDLTPSLGQLHNTIRKQNSELTHEVQRAGGGIGIPGPVSIVTPENYEVPGLPDFAACSTFVDHLDMEDIAEWVTDLDQVVKNLEVGVVTSGRENTVSTEPPSSTEGYPDGAYWTQIQSADELAPIALWRLTDGAWVEQDVPENTITPYLNTGLIDTAVLSAQIIRSDQFWTSLDSMPRVGFNADGFQAYDADGNLTVSLNGVENTLEGELHAGAWTIATRGITHGVFGRVGHEDVSELSPGLVMVSEGSETSWPTYFNLRSQLWATSVGSIGGPDANENVNAYVMVRSAYVKEDDANPDGTYPTDAIHFDNQQILIRNATIGCGSSLWLGTAINQREVRSPSMSHQHTMNLDTSEQAIYNRGSSTQTLVAAQQFGQRKTTHEATGSTVYTGKGFYDLFLTDPDDFREDAVWTTGSRIKLEGHSLALFANHSASMIQLGSTNTGEPAQLRIAADQIYQNIYNTAIRYGQMHVGTLASYVRCTVNIGGWPFAERATPRWHIIIQPYDWANQINLTDKLISVDHAAGQFQMILERVAGDGAVANCGFFWTAIKVTPWA